MRFKQLQDIKLADLAAESVRRSQHEAIRELQRLVKSLLTEGDTLDTANIDGDTLDIDWDPTNSTPDSSIAEAEDVNDLSAILQGMDTEMGNYLLTDGTRDGATSEAQRFENGIELGTDVALAKIDEVAGDVEMYVDDGATKRFDLSALTLSELPTLLPRNSSQGLGSSSFPWANTWFAGREVRQIVEETTSVTFSTGEATIVYTGSGSDTISLPDGPADGRVCRLINAGSGSITLSRSGSTDQIFASGGNVNSISVAIGEAKQLRYLTGNALWYLFAEASL